MKLRESDGLTFDDVLLVPRFSSICSRKDVDLVYLADARLAPANSDRRSEHGYGD